MSAPPTPKSPLRRALVAVFVLSAALVALAAGLLTFRHGEPRRGASRVVLVTIDTLRADHLGCYGYATARTPTLDRLATRGVRFQTAIAHVPLTAPSHASILSGLTPLGHGMRDNGAYVLPAEVRSVAEDFRQAGYLTAAFVSGFPLNRRFGLDRGFETYDDHLPRGNDPRRTAHVERTADRTTDAVLQWLQERARSDAAAAPFFLWVHYFDPHAPYEPPPEWLAGAASPYDGEIAFVDAQIRRLLEVVEAGEKAHGTLVLAIADHGESLGEHGEDTHGIFVYDSTLRVPFLLAGPDVPAGGVTDVVARAIDVAPTLLDYAGLPARRMDGRSLRAAAAGRSLEDAPAYAESLHAQLQYGWAPLHAWRTAGLKLIEAPRAELYDLRADPGEASDRSNVDSARLEGMRRELRNAMETTTPVAAKAIDAETAERLSALGYLGGGAGKNTPPTGRDPKDGIRLATRLGRNGMSVARTEPEKAIRELTALLAEDPGMLVALRTRAVAFEAAGRYEQAIADLRALERAGALTAEDSVVLGDNLRLAGHVQESVEVLKRTAEKNPRFAQPWLSLAAVFVKQKRIEDAATAYGKALEIAPDQIEALRGSADVALIRGDLEAASKHYGRILELDASDTGAMTQLGVLAMRRGQAEEGISLFRTVVQKDPKNGDALLYLAGALASSGRSSEALPFFEQAIAAGQRSTMTLNGMGLARLEVGDRTGAAAAFRESLRIDPRQPDIARTLAQIASPGP